MSEYCRSISATDADAVKQRTKGEAMKFSHLIMVVITLNTYRIHRAVVLNKTTNIYVLFLFSQNELLKIPNGGLRSQSTYI
jgi:hypothetical protein